MASTIYVLAVLSCIGSLSALELQSINGTIKITTVTTAGCGDTVTFIPQQLVPAYEKYRDLLKIEFVPWGRTEYRNGSMWCQFGANDCWANRLHRCALNLLKDNQDAQVSYMACEFSSRPAYFQLSYACAHAAGINLVDVDYCVHTAGGPLDDEAEIAAQVPMQVINFVPAIVFNDNALFIEHHEARSRLSQMLCIAFADDPSSGVTSCNIN